MLLNQRGIKPNNTAVQELCRIIVETSVNTSSSGTLGHREHSASVLVNDRREPTVRAARLVRVHQAKRRAFTDGVAESIRNLFTHSVLSSGRGF